MTNKYLIPIIGAISLATIGGLAYTQLNQGAKTSTKVSVNVSSQQSLAISSFPVLISSSSQMSSSSLVKVSSSAKVEEVKSKDEVVESVVKVESVKQVTKPISTQTCNLPESESLIKTDNGCFELGISVNTLSTTSDDNYHPKSSEELKNVIKNAAKDYYLRTKSKILTKEVNVNISGTKRLSDTNFELYVSIGDPDYLRAQGNDMQSDSGRFNAIYNLNFENNKWQAVFNKD